MCADSITDTKTIKVKKMAKIGNFFLLLPPYVFKFLFAYIFVFDQIFVAKQTVWPKSFYPEKTPILLWPFFYYGRIKILYFFFFKCFSSPKTLSGHKSVGQKSFCPTFFVDRRSPSKRCYVMARHTIWRTLQSRDCICVVGELS